MVTNVAGSFAGKVAFVTGAANGIGRAAALKFASERAIVVAGDVSEQGNRETAGMIEGNLLQRTRCPYFRDVGYASCNKRAPGSGCAAVGGENRWHAVLGTSEHCIAANASDLAVALVALDAAIEVCSASSKRNVLLRDLYELPGSTPHVETVLEPGEVIAAITVPSSATTRRSHYVKVRDRASFEFAVVSAAAALGIDQNRIRQARIAVGGVGTVPWRLPQVEGAMVGSMLQPAALHEAAALAAEGARGWGHNDFKIELMQRAIVRAVEIAGARA
jgi:xanthine dehydrogenase YagS FAD-binding subunit